MLPRNDDYAMLETDEKTDLSYCVMSIPKHLAHDQKMDRLAEFADTVTDVDGSDVFVMALWIPTS